METENITLQSSTVKRKKTQMKKNVKIVFTIILVFIFIVCCIHAAFQLTNSSSATIMINSIYAADGKNPDGTPFSVMELFNDEVMSDAAEKLGGKLSVEELRSHLTIADTMTSSSYAQLEQSIFDGENENTYFPNEYILTYSTISEQIKSEGLVSQYQSFMSSFSMPSKDDVLSAVLDSYQEYYAEKYLNYDYLFELDWTEVDSMDYYNRFEFMDDTIMRLSRFLYYKNSTYMTQNETNTNTEYYDLIVELSQGPSKNIENYEAYITQNGVTNNKDELLRQFRYMQMLKEEENTRKTQEYAVIKDAIEMYDATTTKVVFIPALDGNDEFYMNRTKVGLDYLSEKADDAKLQADRAAALAKYYSYLQTCFGEEYISDEENNQVQIKNTAEQRTHADELYESLKSEIQRLTAEVSVLATEGKKTSNEELITGNTFDNVSVIGLGMSFIKRFVLLSMAAYVVTYAVTCISNNKRKANRGIKE